MKNTTSTALWAVRQNPSASIHDQALAVAQKGKTLSGIMARTRTAIDRADEWRRVNAVWTYILELLSDEPSDNRTMVALLDELETAAVDWAVEGNRSEWLRLRQMILAEHGRALARAQGRR